MYLAKQLVETGQNDCVMALGFEKMERGSLTNKFNDRTNPLDKHMLEMSELVGFSAAPPAAQLFGNAGEEHMKRYGSKPEHFAKIAYKNHKHSVNNPYSQFQDEYTLDQVKNSPQVHRVLTKLQCCPTSDGSACCIVASEAFVRSHKLEAQAVEIVGMEMCTDFESTFTNKSSITLVGYDMAKAAAKRLFEKTNYKPQDVDVVELHDCFSANELITYEALGLCPEGKAHELVERNDNTYGECAGDKIKRRQSDGFLLLLGGKYVINPSGGLISKGHPLGATGLAQCSELCWQLRGQAEKRQVPNAKLALQHNVGLGGAVVVGLYRLGFPEARKAAPAKAATKIPGGNSKIKPTPDGFLVSPLMEIFEKEMEHDPDNLIEKVRGVYGFKVTNGPGGAEGYWVINAKGAKGTITYNSAEKPDVTFIIKDTDVTDLIKGDLNPQKAFFQGKVKVQGNMGLAMKLIDLQRHIQHRIDAVKLTHKL